MEAEKNNNWLLPELSPAFSPIVNLPARNENVFYDDQYWRVRTTYNMAWAAFSD